MTPDRAEHRDTVQGGLLEGHVIGDEEEPPVRRVLVWPLLVAAVLGGFAGATGSRLLDRPPPPPAPPPVVLQVSLGAGPSGLTASDHGVAVVAVPVVVRNGGAAPLMLTGIRITGAGAGFIEGPPDGPGANLPRPLTPGQEVNVRFGMTSDCRVAVRPEPGVTFVVRDEQQVSHSLSVHIPDLQSLWGQTLYDDACAR